ncbi:hypothetical protein HER10_EVM0011307 [Colletotrichum scovillei]|uniref:uncharacterized protein n=1 Tax=Colletotrichum scovillei TaxID=1209932 RepID=UPI0015C2F2DE|nr:uncharacterized protein HER10_EVM0011307 [Colletotrichum scovillei]KAF4781400.1 hypothetical protein HER10_EVM0011307 [Colletotrichum scovillei]
MAGATFLSLPNELVTMIAHYCADAYPLCLVNQRILPFAQQGLYHTINLPHTHYNQLVLLVRTLVETPHLRRLIREVDISLGPDAYYDPSTMETPTNLTNWPRFILDESKLSDTDRHILLLYRPYATFSRTNPPLAVGLLMQVIHLTSHRLQLIGLRSMLLVAISAFSVMKQRVCPELKSLSLLPSPIHPQHDCMFGSDFNFLEHFVAYPTLATFVSSYDLGIWGLHDRPAYRTSLPTKQLILRRTGMKSATLGRALRRFTNLTHLFVDFDPSPLRIQILIGHNLGTILELGAALTKSCPCIEHLTLKVCEQGNLKFFGENPTLEIRSLINSTLELSGLKVFRSRIAMYYSLLETLDERATLVKNWLPRQAETLLLDTTDTEEDVMGVPYFQGVKSLILSLCQAHHEDQLSFRTMVIAVGAGGNIDWKEVVKEAREYGAGTDFRLMVVFFPAMGQAFWDDTWRQGMDIPASLSAGDQRGNAIVDSG